MLLKPLAAVAALTLVFTGVASAAALERPASVPQVRVVPDGPDCAGKGFSEIVMPRTQSVACVHSAGDPYTAEGARYAKAMGIKPAAAPAKCYGNGQTGPRVQMVYGYFAGLPNRAAAVTAQVRTQMAPRMQAVINAQSNGQDLGIRWTCTKNAVDVKVVKFPASVQSRSGNSGETLGRAADYLDSIGLNREDRRYQILWDGWAKNACGVGFLLPVDPVTSLPVSPLNQGLMTIGGKTDPGTVVRPVSKPVLRPVLGINFSTLYSMVFNHVGSMRGPTCFTQGMSTVTAQLHELFHTLGAVQLDAPNANTGHCDDAPSVMCPGGGPGYGGGVSIPFCRKVVVETLDCGMDDYWNPSPTVGSYLLTHLNIAKSFFFGNQQQDRLSASPV